MLFPIGWSPPFEVSGKQTKKAAVFKNLLRNETPEVVVTRFTPVGYLEAAVTMEQFGIANYVIIMKELVFVSADG